MIFGHSLITNTSSNFYHFSLYPFFFFMTRKNFSFLEGALYFFLLYHIRCYTSIYFFYYCFVSPNAK
ncbi:hypothetical protein JHK82_037237 [Glycine max]|uniref:Uncharacterized protein n=2 Tax=Glycine subgen. Soja TaxID=1462606 RepID=A0A0R0GTW8_SOYBN|nr:hypothetical protein JHK85_037988 [Glycine max]RZB82750.1 hypothetical protein D0Y65_031723 [Glycine soja]KAG5113968.1 hypothetical protein JHK82_037237 [Glycine max]KAG5131246.1 hypothetical protein JHK84_037643 [Glycine max]KAH1103264.1 hypothetical protein GYH30_037301 [Glycine max]